MQTTTPPTPAPKVINANDQGKYNVPAEGFFLWALGDQKQVFTAFNEKTGRGYCFKIDPKRNERGERSCWFVHVLLDTPIEVQTKHSAFETRWAFMGIVDGDRASFKPSKKSFLDMGNIAFQAFHTILGMAKAQSLPPTLSIQSKIFVTAEDLIGTGVELSEGQRTRLMADELLAPAQDLRKRKAGLQSGLASMCRRGKL